MKKLFAFTLFFTAVFGYLAYDINQFAAQDETRTADAAIVLGAGVWRGRPSPIFRERINHAIKLYREGYVNHLIFTGGVGFRDGISEGEVGRLYAIENGVPPEAIFYESTSTSTIENLTNAQQVAQAHGLDSFLIVSTSYHMRRALLIADDLGMEAYNSPTRSIRWISERTKTFALVQETVSYARYLILRLFN